MIVGSGTGVAGMVANGPSSFFAIDGGAVAQPIEPQTTIDGSHPAPANEGSTRGSLADAFRKPGYRYRPGSHDDPRLPVHMNPMVRRTLAFSDTHVFEVATVLLEEPEAPSSGSTVAESHSPGAPTAPRSSSPDSSHSSDGACSIRQLITWSAPLADIDAVRTGRAAVLRPAPVVPSGSGAAHAQGDAVAGQFGSGVPPAVGFTSSIECGPAEETAISLHIRGGVVRTFVCTQSVPLP